MTTVEIASLANAAAAIVAAVGIWYGIRAMARANDERGQQQRDAMQQQRDAMQQQREAMQQQREADERRHEEAMQQMQQQREVDERRHEENMAALKALIGGLERQTAALETVVERTASGPAAP